MADLFEEAGISPNQERRKNSGRDLFEEAGIKHNASRNELSLGDFLKNALSQGIFGNLSRGGEEAANTILPEQAKPLAKGISEEIPGTINSSINGLLNFLGKKGMPSPELGKSNSALQTLGRLLGKGGTYALEGAPVAAGFEAILPGLLGASIGSGVAGGALTEGNPEEKLTAAGISSIIPGLGKLVSTGTRLATSGIRSVSPEKAGKIIQDVHDAEMKASTGLFQEVDKGVKQAIKANRLPAFKNIDKSVFQRISKLIPTKSDSFKEMLTKAKSGDYEALRELQQELRVRGEKYRKSPLVSEQNIGDEILGFRGKPGLRTKINTGIEKHLHDSGHKELAGKLAEARKIRRLTQEKYYGEKPVANLVGEDRYIPDSLLKFLSRNHRFYNELRGEHPELQELVDAFKDRQLLKKLGVGGTAHATGLGALKYLFGGGNNEPRGSNYNYREE